MLLFRLVLPSAQAIDCADPISRAELEAAVETTETAWRNVDDTAFRDGLNTLAGVLLPCTGDAVSPTTAAHVHLLMALHLQSNGDADNALASARSARAADPAFVPGPELVPPDHPLRVVWDATPAEEKPRKVPEPKGGSVAFDGIQTREHVPARPSIVQIFDDTGFAKTTTYLGVGESLPAYAAIPRRRNTLLGCSVGATALGGGMYVGAWSLHGDLYSAAAKVDADPDRLGQRRATTNTLSVLSTTLLATAVGCGTGAALTGQR